jgi:3-carboxy-cis,cis-muconate cycloisomerase
LSKYPDIGAHLSEEKLDQLFEPMAYQGVAQILIDRQLASLEK